MHSKSEPKPSVDDVKFFLLSLIFHMDILLRYLISICSSKAILFHFTSDITVAREHTQKERNEKRAMKLDAKLWLHSLPLSDVCNLRYIWLLISLNIYSKLFASQTQQQQQQQAERMWRETKLNFLRSIRILASSVLTFLAKSFVESVQAKYAIHTTRKQKHREREKCGDGH